MIDSMRRVLPAAAITAAALFAEHAAAQQCYECLNRCFSFAPPGAEVDRMETSLNLRSNSLTVTGDIRWRAHRRFAGRRAV